MTDTDVTYTTLKNLAIKQASDCKWEEAITTNLMMLESYPHDITTLNRLGRAYAATGNLQQAKESYQQVLAISPDNTIAHKNLEKLKLFNNADNLSSGNALNPSQFLKHSGKTKIVSLTNLASIDIIARINCGDCVQLIPRPRTIMIANNSGKKIGRLPDDISYRLIQLINLGYQYSACIKSTTNKKVQIVIQETAKPANASTHVSFLGK